MLEAFDYWLSVVNNRNKEFQAMFLNLFEITKDDSLTIEYVSDMLNGHSLFQFKIRKIFYIRLWFTQRGNSKIFWFSSLFCSFIYLTNLSYNAFLYLWLKTHTLATAYRDLGPEPGHTRWEPGPKNLKWDPASRNWDPQIDSRNTRPCDWRPQLWE